VPGTGTGKGMGRLASRDATKAIASNKKHDKCEANQKQQ